MYKKIMRAISIKLSKRVKHAFIFSLIFTIPFILIHIYAFYTFSTKTYYAFNGFPRGLYQPVVGDTDMMSTYAPRVKEVTEKRFIISDVCVNKNKNGPSILPILNPIIYGSIGRVIAKINGENGVVHAKIFSDMFFPFFILFAFYLAYGRIFKGWILPSVFTCLTIIKIHAFAIMIDNPGLGKTIGSIKYIFKFSNYDIVSDIVRWDCPNLTYIFYGLFFLFAVYAIAKNTKTNYILWAVFTGLLGYVYLYHFIYASVLFSLTMLILAATKNTEWENVFIAYFVYILIISYYLYNTYRVINLENFEDIRMRIGYEEGRFLRLGFLKHYLLDISLCGLIIYLYRLKNIIIDKKYLLFALMIFTANIVVMNIQIITGFIPHPDHWFRYAIGPAFGIGTAIILKNIIDEINMNKVIKKCIKLGSVIFIVYMFSSHLVSSLDYSNKLSDWYEIRDEILFTMNFINKNTKPEDVVLSINHEINYAILTYTKANPYILDAILTTASQDELLRRLFNANKAYNVPVKVLKEALVNSKSLFIYTFCEFYMCNKPYYGVVGGKENRHKEKMSYIDKIADMYVKHNNYSGVWCDDIKMIIETPWDYYKSDELRYKLLKNNYKLIYNKNGWKYWRIKNEL